MNSLKPSPGKIESNEKNPEKIGSVVSEILRDKKRGLLFNNIEIGVTHGHV